jgi:hypothetical protein
MNLARETDALLQMISMAALIAMLPRVSLEFDILGAPRTAIQTVMVASSLKCSENPSFVRPRRQRRYSETAPITRLEDAVR